MRSEERKEPAEKRISAAESSIIRLYLIDPESGVCHDTPEITAKRETWEGCHEN